MAEAAGLYYELHGPADAPPLILSSGLGGSASYWAPNLDALAEHHRVLLYDHRGTGRSDRSLPGATSVEDMAADVVALMDALDIGEAGFVGHALGGLIGLAIARAHGARLSRLVVVNGWLALDPHSARCFDARLDLLRHGGLAAYLRAQPLFLYPPDWISAHHDRIERENARHLGDFPEPATVEKRIAAARAFRMEPPDRVGCALLAVVAEDDMLVPPSAGKAVTAAAADARLATMTGGHACNVTDPETFNRVVLDFLRS